MSEFFREPPLRIWGEELELQDLSSEELMHYGSQFQYPFLIHRAHERQVVEGAEEMLKELNDKPKEMEEQ